MDLAKPLPKQFKPRRKPAIDKWPYPGESSGSEFMVANVTEPGPNDTKFRPGESQFAKRGRKRYAVRQLLESKEVLMQDILSKDTTPSARAQLVRALVAADEQIMARKGIPTPRPVEVERKPKRSGSVPAIVPMPAKKAS